MTELQGWRQAYCPECRKEYPVPIRDYSRLVEGGDVMFCPYGHKIPTRAQPRSTPQAVVVGALVQPPPTPSRLEAVHGEQMRYCIYCRTTTRQTRNGSETSWTCAQSELHKPGAVALHWLEEAVVTFARRVQDVDRLEEEVAVLRREVAELRGQQT